MFGARFGCTHQELQQIECSKYTGKGGRAKKFGKRAGGRHSMLVHDRSGIHGMDCSGMDCS